MGHYDVAQLCVNGHLITDDAKSNPSSTRPFCSECSAPTIMACSNGHPIQGAYQTDRPILGGVFDYDRPSYCDQCGIAYPWTTTSIEAARELIQFSEQLNQTEKDDFKTVIPDLITDTPKTKVAFAKFSAYAKKMGKEAASGIRDIVVDIASEAVKKSIWKG